MLDPNKECLALRDQIARDRNYLHKNPELSGQEEATMAWIARRLNQLGIRWRTVDHGGLVATLSGSGAGKRLLLRADTDGLPVAENNRNQAGDKRAVSQVPGVSHACGHDAHAAMLLGTLEVLSLHRADWEGELVAVFERGEETAYGAGCGAPHHSPEFDLDENQLYLGAAAHVAYALAFLDHGFPAPARRDSPALLRQLKQQLL